MSRHKSVILLCHSSILPTYSHRLPRCQHHLTTPSTQPVARGVQHVLLNARRFGIQPFSRSVVNHLWHATVADSFLKRRHLFAVAPQLHLRMPSMRKRLGLSALSCLASLVLCRHEAGLHERRELMLLSALAHELEVYNGANVIMHPLLVVGRRLRQPSPMSLLASHCCYCWCSTVCFGMG